MSFTIRKAQACPFNDDFSARWSALVLRSKKTKLWKKKAEHLEILQAFEQLINDRRSNDDLPYAALVAMSMGRYLESCADQNAPQVRLAPSMRSHEPL